MGLRALVLKALGVPTKTFSAPMPIDAMFAAMLGAGAVPSVGRLEALSVPAVLRGRNLICSISTLPLVQYNKLREPIDNPLFRQLDHDIPNVTTLAATVEDLLFEGIAWWLITEQAFDGFPTGVQRLDPGQVSMVPPNGDTPSPLPAGYDPRGAVVYVDGQPVPASRMIRFDSPNPGLLKVGGRAIHRALLLDRLARMYADDPRPMDYFTPAEGADPADDDQIQTMLDSWKAARKLRSTGYVPAALKYNAVDAPNPVEIGLVQLQQQVTLDIANMMGIDPEDLGINVTTRTYNNATDRRKDRINETLAPYMRAITDRLSMGDVTPRGHYVAFDLDNYLQADPKTRVEVQEKYLAMGVITVDDIAAEENLPVPTSTGATVENSRPPVAIFSTGATFVDLPLETFSVDTESRTITGQALPYGRSAKGFRFERGSLQFGDVSRVKLLRDHDPKQAIGYAVELRDTPEGFLAKFKVARGPEGDAALQLAEDKVLDGLSVGVDFTEKDVLTDPRHKGGYLVRRADLREVSLTAMPAFDDARLTSVKASLTEENDVSETTTEPTTAPEPIPAVVPGTFTAEPVAPRQVVNPTRVTGALFVRESLPYRFDRGGNFQLSQHEFSTDIVEMLRSRDEYGQSEAGKRVMGLLQARFTVETGDVNELNPNIQRPDMYVDQADYKYPIWNLIRKGTPPNGVQPFTFPKFNSASGLVGDHTEGTEPTSGNFTTTSQTVTPTAISGKASITRETWDMGGNPAVSTLIFNQMVRGYREGLESAAATFLNTLTAATDITLTTAAVDEALSGEWDAALAGLHFTRSYDWSGLVLEQVLYKAFVAARDNDGRVLYPQTNPVNANGSTVSGFGRLNLGGVIGLPAWALASTPGAANNSWLFDPSVVHGWATAPQRLQFAGTAGDGSYAPTAFIDVAIWGYKALANSDIAGVRQVIYDSVS